MEIQWKYWWDTSRWCNLGGGSVTEDTLHVAGKLGTNAYGISVKADMRFEQKYLAAAKELIAKKLH